MTSISCQSAKEYPRSISYFTGQENPVSVSSIQQFAQYPAKPWSSLPQDNVDTKCFHGFQKTLYKFVGPIVILSRCPAMLLMTEDWCRLLYLFLSVMTEGSLDHGLEMKYADIRTSSISTHHDSCRSIGSNSGCQDYWQQLTFSHSQNWPFCLMKYGQTWQ